MTSGCIYINEEGKFLVLSERTTHTGKHIDVEFTSDINQASVLVRLEREVLRRHPDLERYARPGPACIVHSAGWPVRWWSGCQVQLCDTGVPRRAARDNQYPADRGRFAEWHLRAHRHRPAQEGGVMANEAERILKMDKCMSVKFHAKDKDGDTVFVDIEGDAAQQILDYIKAGFSGIGVWPPLTKKG